MYRGWCKELWTAVHMYEYMYTVEDKARIGSFMSFENNAELNFPNKTKQNIWSERTRNKNFSFASTRKWDTLANSSSDPFQAFIPEYHHSWWLFVIYAVLVVSSMASGSRQQCYTAWLHSWLCFTRMYTHLNSLRFRHTLVLNSVAEPKPPFFGRLNNSIKT